jgi:putative peptidoglycan lipid II flippase
MRAMFARGAFTKGDAAAAGATLAAYAIGLIPFVLIRSAVATFYARRDTATPVKAALIGVAVNVALKIALVGPLAQVGLAFATAIGAWINLSLVIAFAIRARYLELDRALLRSVAKFVAAGVVLGAALWLTAGLSASYVSGLSAGRDEVVFLALIAVGSAIYAAAILILFGRRWVMSLVKG